MDERALKQQIGEMRQQNKELTDLVKTLNGTIVELQETIRELRRQLNQNSQNSSKPPSSDGYNKPSPKKSACQKREETRRSNGISGKTYVNTA